MPCGQCEAALRHQLEAVETEGVSALRDEQGFDLEDDDNDRGEQSINRLWPESTNDGDYTDAPTETGAVARRS